MRFKKEFIIGLDIGSSSVKMVKLAMKGESVHIKAAQSEEIVQVDDEASKERATLLALKKIIAKSHLQDSEVIVGLNCPRTTIKKVVVPQMPKDELAEGIRLESKNYFPFPVEGAHLDYNIMGEIEDQGVKKYELIVATCPKDTIDKSLSLLGKAGIKPASLVPACYGLKRLVETVLTGKDEVRCLVDIGNSQSELIIFKGEDLIFSRTIPISGQDFTKSMMAILSSEKGRVQLTFDEAERIKREIGIPREGETKMVGEKINTSQILSMLRSPLSQLVNEIDRCLHYYREETGRENVGSIVLTGRGSALKGLPSFLSEELGMEVRLARVPEGVKVEDGGMDFKEKPFEYAVALGAAVSTKDRINLLPIEIKEQTSRTLKRAAILSIAVGAALILTFIYIGMKIQLANYRKKIPVAEMEFASLSPQLKEAEMQYLANLALSKEPYWEDVFKELSNITPEDIYLNEIHMEDESIVVKGIVVSEEKEKLLSGFIFALEKGIFKNVRLVKTEEVTKAENEFELKFWVDG